MKIKGNMTENFTIEAVGRAYELNLISQAEAREMIRRIWGTESFEGKNEE